MLGQVGDDEYGRLYIDFLNENGIDTSCIIVNDDAPTGQAYIMSQRDGDNSIVIVGGSN